MSETDYQRAERELDAMMEAKRLRIAFKGLQGEAFRLIGEIRLASHALPDYFADSTCECGDDQELQVVEDGYSQWCNVTKVDAETRTVFAYNHGWDDMSDEGQVSYLECKRCYTVWALPDDVEWS